jgi:hypothetical protein
MEIHSGYGPAMLVQQCLHSMVSPKKDTWQMMFESDECHWLCPLAATTQRHQEIEAADLHRISMSFPSGNGKR